MTQAHDATDNAADWVAADIPGFAVVGRVNMGKSAVLATLLEEDDDRIIRISTEPGETTRCQCLSLFLDDAERLRFIDTPGFQQPIAALRRIRAMAEDNTRGPGPQTLAAFVQSYRGRGEFEDECQLLAPLVAGAGVVYVVDPNVPLTDAFLAEIEVLRLSAGPRLAVLNPHSRASGADDAANHERDWRTELGKTFNLVRTFDAFNARYRARRDLLVALNQIDERDKAHLQTTIELLDAEWQQRREEAAEYIQDFLRQALALREHASYDDTQQAPEQARKKAIAQASQLYYERIAELERQTAEQVLGIYRHRHTRAEVGSYADGGLDLAREQTWQRLGLSRQQLTWVGTVVGAGAGLAVDAGTLGGTLGLAGLIGGGVGGALAWFKGDALPSLNISLGRRSMGVGDGQRVTIGPPRSANFAWILLDSALMRYQDIISHTHAHRGGQSLPGQNGQKREGVVYRLGSEQQKSLASWFKTLLKNTEDTEGATQARLAIEAMLAELEQGLPDQ